MASIEKRERNKGTVYRITVRFGNKKYNTTFVPEPSWSESKVKKELNAFAVNYEQAVISGKLFDGSKISFEDYCKDWLNEKAALLSPTTLEYYDNVINNKFILAFSGLKMTDIKPRHIKDYILNLKGANGQNLKPSSIKKELSVLKSIFKTAWEDSIIDTNPTERVKPPKQDNASNLKHFTLEQTQAFLDLLDSPLVYTYKEHKSKNKNMVFSVQQYKVNHTIATQFKLFYSLAIMTGARKGELLAITWNDIDFENCTLSISKEAVLLNKQIIIKEPKTKNSIRTIALPSSMISLIKRYRAEWNEYKLLLGTAWEGENNLFIQNNGKIMHPSTPYHKFIEIIENYNANCDNESEMLPKIPLHGLRHTSATLLISQNVDIKTVSKRLGHAQTSTTINIYTHSLEKQDRESADTMNELLHVKVN